MIGEHEPEPEGAFVRLLPFPFDAHFFPWWSAETRSVLEAMAGVDLRGKHVVDFGCGASAILALAAGRLGAGQVTAIDRQPSLVAEARRQVAANMAAVNVVLGTEPVECDFLVANVGDAVLAGVASRYAPHGIATDNEGGLIQW